MNMLLCFRINKNVVVVAAKPNHPIVNPDSTVLFEVPSEPNRLRNIHATLNVHVDNLPETGDLQLDVYKMHKNGEV